MPNSDAPKIDYIQGHSAVLDAHTKNPWELLKVGNYMQGYPTYDWAVTTSSTAGRIDAQPFIAVRPMTVDRMAVEVTLAGNAGDNARLGIYEDDGTMYPGVLLLDCGEVAVDGVGVVAATISQALSKGVYWLAVLHEAGNAEFRACRPAFNGLGVRDTNFSQPYYGYYKTGVAYGALPDPFVAGATIWYNPLVISRLRLASLD